jgi:hypothetical protein
MNYSYICRYLSYVEVTSFIRNLRVQNRADKEPLKHDVLIEAFLRRQRYDTELTNSELNWLLNKNGVRYTIKNLIVQWFTVFFLL